MWRSDGWDVRIRIGVLTPHADVGPESELQAMAPDGVGIHAARVPFGAMGAGGTMDPTIPLAPVAAFAEPPHIDDATALLAAAPVHAIGIAFTSTGYLLGVDGETAMVTRLEQSSSGIPVVSTCAAAVLALRSVRARRLAVVNPPWFDADLDALGAKFFTSQGFDVVSHGPCGLPSKQRSINPPELYDWVRKHTPATADAVFIGGNGFRAVGIIEALEQDLERPVLTANQVLLWHCLRVAAVHLKPHGYGRLFDSDPVEPIGPPS